MSETTVKLISWTRDPLETLWKVWQASRNNEPIGTIDKHPDEDGRHEVWMKLFRSIIHEDIPIAEMIDLVFLLENVPISLREQLVRHRIGVKVGDRLGIDLIPELEGSTFWSQSMRILDMGSFAFDGGFIVPESIECVETALHVSRSKIPLAIYQQAMRDAQRAYQALVERGIPLEDARNVIPLGATHRLVWKLNLASLKHIVSKRACWILQLGLWKPVITGMVDELVSKIAEDFRELATPPCIKNDKFQQCHFCENNQQRVIGEEDEIPPCPIYLKYHKNEIFELTDRRKRCCQSTNWHHSSGEPKYWFSDDEKCEKRMLKMQQEYEALWHRKIVDV